ALVRSKKINKVAFTGSTPVGRDIQAALAGQDTKLTLELGGKSANIVFEDAALDQAVEGIVNGIFFNQGHVCCAGSRLLIHDSARYGLAAGIWSEKGAKAFEVASALQAGVVWQNTYNHFDPTAAFGGYKESGFGREGGPAGLRPYLRIVR